MSEFLKALTALPQIVENIRKMSEEEKRLFVEQLGLEGEERETALGLIKSFQEGKPLTGEQQTEAQKLLEKALKITNLDLNALLKMRPEQ